MGQITINVNDQKFTLSCRDGEEERLASLAQYVNSKAVSLTQTLGQIGETHLLLMSALLIADELQDNRERLSECEARSATGDPKAPERLTAVFARAASDIEGIAAKLEAS